MKTAWQNKNVTQAGAYMILPTTFEPGQEATFTFRLKSRISSDNYLGAILINNQKISVEIIWAILIINQGAFAWAGQAEVRGQQSSDHQVSHCKGNVSNNFKLVVAVVVVVVVVVWCCCRVIITSASR